MPTDWEARYRNADAPWDKGAPHPALLRWLAMHPGRMTERVLVPGCGLGHDVRAIATAEPTSDVLGLDIAPSAIAAASRLDHPANAAFVVGDLFDLAPEHRGRFAWVWEHTCFCAIDPDGRDDYVRAVARSLLPGGHLLGVFYLDPYRGDHRPGGGPPHGCSLEELAMRFVQSGLFAIVESGVPSITYPERDGRERLMLMQRSRAMITDPPTR